MPTGKLTADGKEMKKITLLKMRIGPKELFQVLVKKILERQRSAQRGPSNISKV